MSAFLRNRSRFRTTVPGEKTAWRPFDIGLIDCLAGRGRARPGEADKRVPYPVDMNGTRG